MANWCSLLCILIGRYHNGSCQDILYLSLPLNYRLFSIHFRQILKKSLSKSYKLPILNCLIKSSFGEQQTLKNKITVSHFQVNFNSIVFWFSVNQCNFFYCWKRGWGRIVLQIFTAKCRCVLNVNIAICLKCCPLGRLEGGGGAIESVMYHNSFHELNSDTM